MSAPTPGTGQADVGALYAEHWPAIYRFLRRRVGDDATAEDLAADVFLRVVQAADRYDDRGIPPGAWLARIARNLLTDHYRYAARRPSVALDSVTPGGRATVDAGSDRQVERIRVAQALLKLTRQQRTVIVEQYLIGSSCEETALVLGCGEDNVRKLRHRAHHRLRQILRVA